MTTTAPAVASLGVYHRRAPRERDGAHVLKNVYIHTRHAPACAPALVSLRGVRARADQGAPGVARGAPHAVPVARHFLSTRALRPGGAPAEARVRPGRAPATPSAAPLAKRRRGELCAHHNPKHLIRVNTIGFTSPHEHEHEHAHAHPHAQRARPRPASHDDEREHPLACAGLPRVPRRTTRSVFLPPSSPSCPPLPSPPPPPQHAPPPPPPPPPHQPAPPPARTHARRHLWEESRSSPGAPLCGRERAGAYAAACRPHVRAGRGLRRAVKGTFGGGQRPRPKGGGRRALACAYTVTHSHTQALTECAEGGGVGGELWGPRGALRALSVRKNRQIRLSRG